MKKGRLTSAIWGFMLTLILLSSGLAIFAIVNLSYSLGDARAINASGSLRMQSYRLMFYANSGSESAAEKIEEFENTLNSQALKATLAWYTPQDMKDKYLTVIDKWQIMRYYIESENSRLYAAALKDFVDTIDLFVLETEQHAAFKLKLLAISQIVGLGIMLLIAFVTVRIAKRKVVKPLQQLMQAADTISQGDFNVVMPKTEYIELSALSSALDSTIKKLASVYQGLESQVQEKTLALTRANNELKLLYDNVVMLHSSKLDINTLTDAINQLQTHEPNISLRLVVVEDEQVQYIIDAQGEWPHDVKNSQKFALQFEQNNLGYLEVISERPYTTALYSNFAIMLARSMVIHNAGEQRQQLALMEERGVIARELHDSLGQLLSFLKIQVNLLSKELDKTSKSPRAAEQLQEINEGVNTAYAQLRELLSTFRLTIKDPNLGHAIEAMVEQLRSQSDANITLDYKLPVQLLGAQQHIHILQLTREATLNAIKHASAQHIHISCQKISDTKVIISISDDGLGIEKLKERDQHFGLGIMHERASRLSGVVEFSQNEEGGATVTLTFPPQQEPV
ncbi:nitrate/nitrite two-component system sensor histidine kinase NarQ [Shewanella sp. Choline-02u-19]|uniref:nitrate/nitrite two-component system sensor histidine kinase NarQ n=1 Tax=unclassified Shewanella TaxID=196818 RepID=UPI000C32773C|nr:MULTISPECIES: nitrate/nitrite two-component system sensor histidine kinase NarQ [unclassified Shewanella]PKG56211.1 nitrate/nitrite two-component system sensor histidine kinase NarQ [Shewanella sp. GutDb-MelDb]PKH56764.1 nitrate/nitrite two-component system sensor histidine kinase NarQ [Shewanella sp. Bg11-22]PKI30315.1 nitrate/nitrite two-component system sensor histidine kinase NarQ [Shewanella sp. Choline-02u-19]